MEKNLELFHQDLFHRIEVSDTIKNWSDTYHNALVPAKKLTANDFVGETSISITISAITSLLGVIIGHLIGNIGLTVLLFASMGLIGSACFWYKFHKKSFLKEQISKKNILANKWNKQAYELFNLKQKVDDQIQDMNNLLLAADGVRPLTEDELIYYHKLKQEVQQIREGFLELAEAEFKASRRRLNVKNMESITIKERTKADDSIDVPSLEREVIEHEKKAMAEIAERDRKLALIGSRR